MTPSTSFSIHSVARPIGSRSDRPHRLFFPASHLGKASIIGRNSVTVLKWGEMTRAQDLPWPHVTRARLCTVGVCVCVYVGGGQVQT